MILKLFIVFLASVVMRLDRFEIQRLHQSRRDVERLVQAGLPGFVAVQRESEGEFHARSEATQSLERNIPCRSLRWNLAQNRQ